MQVSTYPLPQQGPPSPGPGIWKLVLPESPAHLIPSPPGLPGGYSTLAPGALFTMPALPLGSQLSSVLGPFRGKAKLLHWAPGTCDFRFTFSLPPHPPPCPAPACPSFLSFPNFFLFQGAHPPRDSSSSQHPSSPQPPSNLPAPLTSQAPT